VLPAETIVIVSVAADAGLAAVIPEAAPSRAIVSVRTADVLDRDMDPP
jgi:hypothetical protein